jgi:hypothetical protein
MAFLLEASFSEGTDNLIDQLLINQTVLKTVRFQETIKLSKLTTHNQTMDNTEEQSESQGKNAARNRISQSQHTITIHNHSPKSQPTITGRNHSPKSQAKTTARNHNSQSQHTITNNHSTQSQPTITGRNHSPQSHAAITGCNHDAQSQPTITIHNHSPQSQPTITKDIERSQQNLARKTRVAESKTDEVILSRAQND